MADKAWKAAERAIAQRLGGTRIGNRGTNTPDIEHGWLAPEVKERKTLPAWLKDAMSQAVTNARPCHLPVVILHELGQRHDNDLVVMRLKDFEEWYGETDNDVSDTG